MKYFTADPHFNHEGIILYCNRPFKDKKEMNERIIESYNKVLKDYDTLYIIGDLWYPDKKIINAIKGHKILIKGNHDTRHDPSYIKMGFKSVAQSSSIEFSGYKFLLMHDPCFAIVAAHYNFDYLLCGHVHNLFKIVGNAINVGVDVWDYRPVSQEEILHTILEYKRVEKSRGV